MKIIMDEEYNRLHERLTDGGEPFILDGSNFTCFRDGKMIRVINKTKVLLIPVNEYIRWRRSHVCVCV